MSDVIIPSVFTPYTQQRTKEKTTIVSPPKGYAQWVQTAAAHQHGVKAISKARLPAALRAATSKADRR